MKKDWKCRIGLHLWGRYTNTGGDPLHWQKRSCLQCDELQTHRVTPSLEEMENYQILKRKS